MRIAVLLLTLIGSLAGATPWTQVHPFAESEAECSPVDLRSSFGPARDQGNIGWCYANVTADLLTFYYKKDLGTERVSSGYTALTFNHIGDQPAFSEGGVVGTAIKAASEEGLCPESIETEVMKAGPKMRIKQKLDSFIHFKHLYDAGKTNPIKRAEFRKQLQTYRTTNSTLFTLRDAEIGHLLQTSTENTFPLEFARLLCRGHRLEAHPPTPVMSSLDKEDFAHLYLKLSPTVHQQLEDGKPVAIGYAAQFLLNDNVSDWQFSWHRLQWDRLQIKRDSGAARHASMIVGRRWNAKANRCEFILRNSWGTGCHYKNPMLAAAGQCEAGNLFVDQQFLEKQMYRIFYFENPWLSALIPKLW